MVYLSLPLLALPIIEIISYIIIVTRLHKYFSKGSLHIDGNVKLKNFISSTTMTERNIVMVHDEILHRTMIYICIFGLLFIVLSSFFKKVYKWENIDLTYTDSLQTHLFFTFTLSLLALYIISSKTSFYIYTLGITTSLFLTDVSVPHGNIVFFARSLLMMESTAYFLGYRGLLINVVLNLFCYVIVHYIHFKDDKGMLFKDKIINELNLEYIFAMLWFCNYSFRVEHKNEILVKLLERSTKSKTDFLARMSHQLRTPLFGIVGSLDILQNEGLTHSQYSTIKIIQSCCDNLLATISDILDLSKIEFGKISLRESLINLYSLVNNSIEIVYSQMISKNIEITKILDKPLPKFFLGDESRIKQVLVNLLSNSVKFTGSGGKITLVISTDNDILTKFKEFPQSFSINPDILSAVGKGIYSRPKARKRRSSLSLFGNREENVLGNLNFLIADTGIGITEAQSENIFVPFFRTNPSNHKVNEGIGLGLTIAKYFIEEMNGTINFYSGGYNKGTIFCFSIPYKVPNVELKKRKTKPAVPKLVRASTKEEINPNVFPHLASPAISAKKHFLLKSNSDDLFKSIVPFSASKLITDPATAEKSNNKSGKKILVAEDNELNRSIIVRMLKPHGYDIDIAENGRIAYHMCKQTKLRGEEYNFILMDLEMPLMGGIETTKKIREELNLSTPIIALSANAIYEVRELAMNAGFNDFVSKPFDQKVLTNAIKKCKKKAAS